MTERYVAPGRVAAALVWGMVLVPVVAAGDVKGVVVDYYFPNSPVSGAKVFLNTGNGRTQIDTTAADGTFSKAQVTNGPYSLEVTKPTYKQMPQQPQAVNVDNGANDLGTAYLYSPNEKPEYFKKNGADFANILKERKAEDKKTAYAELWKRLTLGSASATSKFYVAQAVNGADDSVKEYSPPMKAYLAVSPDDITKAEIDFGRVFQANAEIPPKSRFTDELKIPDDVLKDVMLHQIRTKGTKERNDKLFKELNADDAWKELSKDVEAEHNAMMLRSSRILPP